MTSDSHAHDRSFPDQPVRIITVEAGGGGDFVTRLIAQELSSALGQPVTVDNRLETEAIELVAKAPADGYTLLAFGSPFWTRPLVQKTPYDPVRDFAPITWATMSPMVLVVHPALGVNSVAELLELARARPGELKYAAGLNGSSSQLAAGLFAYMAKADITCVPYKTGPLGLKDLIAGKVQMMMPSAGTVLPMVRSGQLKALGVSSAQPSALVPGLPAIASQLPGYDAVQSIVLFAPAGTPQPIIQRLNQDVVRLLKTAEVREQLLSAGLEPVASSPEELAARMKSEMARWSKMIKDAGIRAN